MAKECSFDVVSEFDKQELVNAVDQTKRDIVSRFDLKNSKSEIELEADKTKRRPVSFNNECPSQPSIKTQSQPLPP